MIDDCEKAASEVLKTLISAGYTAYFVGGWVRDKLLGHPSADIDIATDASPENIMELFPKTIPVGVQFGAIVVVHGEHSFEVSSFRSDGCYINGRKPESVKPATPEEDAQRRDFTINGLFYDYYEERIIDYVGGQEDIKNRVIRAIGDPYKRFEEDRLRLMRAVRYSCNLEFNIDSETRKAIREYASQLLPAVSPERIWQEFNKFKKGQPFSRALDKLHAFGLLPVIFPELEKLSQHEICEQTGYLAHFPLNAPTILYVAELFPQILPEKIDEIGKRLKISNVDRKLWHDYWDACKLFQRDKRDKRCIERIEWAHFYAKEHSELFIEIIALKMGRGVLGVHKERQKDMQAHIRRIREGRPLIDANTLMKYGVPEGKRLGMLLKEAERISVNQDIHYPADVLNKLRHSGIWIGDKVDFL